MRTAGEAGQVAWRIPAASAAGIVRSGPGAGRDVRGGGSQTCRMFRTGRHRRRGRGSSESPAPLRGREANARPRPAGLPGPAGRHRAARPGRARAGPDRGLDRHPHPPGHGQRRPRLRLHREQHRGSVQQHLLPLRRQLQPRLHRLQHHQPCCTDRDGNGILPFPSRSVRRCVRTQAVRARSLCSGLFGRVGPP